MKAAFRQQVLIEFVRSRLEELLFLISQVNSKTINKMGDEDGQSETESTKERKESFEMTKTSKKIIRVITVTTYLFSVSMAAIMLSLYYLFFWNPTVQSGPQRLVDPIQLHFSRLYFNVTQKVGRGSPNGTVGSEIKFAGNDKEKMYEPKHRRKLVRVLTVIAYLFSVSLAAIMLSLFYVFIYNPGKPARDPAFSHSFTPIYFHEPNQETLEEMNDTYLSQDREEPRALPVTGSKDIFQTQLEVLTNNQTHSKYSDGFGKKNRTIYL